MAAEIRLNNPKAYHKILKFALHQIKPNMIADYILYDDKIHRGDQFNEIINKHLH